MGTKFYNTNAKHANTTLSSLTSDVNKFSLVPILVHYIPLRNDIAGRLKWQPTPMVKNVFSSQLYMVDCISRFWQFIIKLIIGPVV